MNNSTSCDKTSKLRLATEMLQALPSNSEQTLGAHKACGRGATSYRTRGLQSRYCLQIQGNAFSTSGSGSFLGCRARKTKTSFSRGKRIPVARDPD